MKTAWFRASLAAAALVAVSACSSGMSPTSSTLPAAGGGTGGTDLRAASKGHAPGAAGPQQSILGAALSIAASGADYGRLGSKQSSFVRMIERGHQIARIRIRSPHIPLPTCKNGIEYSETSNGAGQTSQTLEYFYDKACTMPWELYQLTTDYSSTGGSANASAMGWDSSGAIVDYYTYNMTFTLDAYGHVTSISTEKTAGPMPGRNPYAQVGFACVFNSGNAVDCGEGIVNTLSALGSGSDGDAKHPHSVTPTPTPSPSPSPSASPSSAPGDVGFTATAVGTYATPAPGHGHGDDAKPADKGWGHDGALNITINGAAFDGAAGTLTLAPGTPPAWTITGGTQVDTLTGTATIGYGGWGDGWGDHARSTHPNDEGWGGGASSIKLTLVDSADGLTVNLTSGRWGGLTGTVTLTATGQTVATMTVDYNGNGSIAYSNGTSANVVDWVVVN